MSTPAPPVRLGLHLSAEELSPGRIVVAARRAEEAGFDLVTVSDHFHPWTRRQGESPFVWSVLGAIAQATERVQVGTAVTCPTVRIHPAIIAQAAATTAVMCEGRFFLGLGTGERLNEAILGDPWPPAVVRREMLEEAVEVMRALWSGEVVRAHHGAHYTVEGARLFTLPETPPPIVVSGFGHHSAALAGRIADGYMHVAPEPDLVQAFRDAGGQGKRCYAKLDTCVAEDDAAARRIALETWPNSGLQGELGQQLAMPEHYEQATANVHEDEVAAAILCAGDPERHLEAIRELAGAGFDHVIVQQCGLDQDRLIDLYAQDVLPRVRSAAA